MRKLAWKHGKGGRTFRGMKVWRGRLVPDPGIGGPTLLR